MKWLGALAHSIEGLTRLMYAASWKRSPPWAAWHSLSFLDKLIPVIVNYLLEALRRCLAWPGLELAMFFLTSVAGLIQSFPPRVTGAWEPPPAWSLNIVWDATKGMQDRGRSYPLLSSWGLSISTLWDLTSVASMCVISAGSRGGIQALVQLPRCSTR